jgi:hypothetical protein
MGVPAEAEDQMVMHGYGMAASVMAQTYFRCDSRSGYPHSSKPTSLIVRRSWWSERRCNHVTMTAVASSARNNIIDHGWFWVAVNSHLVCKKAQLLLFKLSCIHFLQHK